METQAAQIQKKLQIELDSFKTSQKGKIIKETWKTYWHSEKVNANVFLFDYFLRLQQVGAATTTPWWAVEWK